MTPKSFVATMWNGTESCCAWIPSHDAGFVWGSIGENKDITTTALTKLGLVAWHLPFAKGELSVFKSLHA